MEKNQSMVIIKAKRVGGALHVYPEMEPTWMTMSNIHAQPSKIYVLVPMPQKRKFRMSHVTHFKKLTLTHLRIMMMKREHLSTSDTPHTRQSNHQGLMRDMVLSDHIIHLETHMRQLVATHQGLIIMRMREQWAGGMKMPNKTNFIIR